LPEETLSNSEVPAEGVPGIFKHGVFEKMEGSKNDFLLFDSEKSHGWVFQSFP
jgi:hypothetical protein